MAKLTGDLSAPDLRFLSPERGVEDSGPAQAVSAVSDFFRAADFNAANKNLQAARDQEALSQYALDVSELENQEAAFMETKFQLEDQIFNEKDAARLQQLQSQYRRMVQAEVAGASPGSIAARKRALVTSFMASNPHLSTEANRIRSELDGFVDIQESAGGEDPILSAQNAMLEQATRGVSIDLQTETAHLEAQNRLSTARLETKKIAGEESFADYFVAAESAAVSQSLAIRNELHSMVTDPQFQGINGTELKLEMQNRVDQYVLTSVAQIRNDMRARGRVVTPEQLRSLSDTVRSNVMATISPVLDTMDKADWTTRAKTILDNQLEVASLSSLNTAYRNYPQLAEVAAFMGGDPASTAQMFKEVFRMLGIYSREGGDFLYGKIAQGDPQAQLAARTVKAMVENGSLIEMFGQAIQNPGQASSGNPAVDKAVTGLSATAVEAKDTPEEMRGAAFAQVLYGDSAASLGKMLSDKTFQQVRTNPEFQTKVTRFADNDSTGILSRIQDDLWESGGIRFSPVPPIRGTRSVGSLELTGSTPARAFSAAPGASREVQKAVNKLNTLYTLMGAYRSQEELTKWGESLGKYSNTENPEFITRYLTNEMNTKIANLENFRDNPPSAVFSPSVFDRNREQKINTRIKNIRSEYQGMIKDLLEPEAEE